MLLGSFLLSTGIWFTLLLAVGGLGFAFVLIRGIIVAPAGDGRMKQVAAAIEEGARAYLKRQVNTISVIAVIIFLLTAYFKGWPTAVGFLIGATCSLVAGYVGMRIAVLANVRTAYAAGVSRHAALRVAFNGGAVTGLLVVGLALLSVGLFYLVAVRFAASERDAINSLIGLALGSSLISVFARLGGGIYTKAADVGADLVGKIESHLDEDDPRNPATIADNVGDNVGDCAGMAADVFETYAVSLIGAVLIGALTLQGVPAAIVYPFLLGGISVIGAVLGIMHVNRREGVSPGRALLEAVAANCLISAVLYLPITYWLFSTPHTINGITYTAGGLYMASLVGLAMTGAIVLITNYYTSTSFSPVRKIALACETGHATNIIAGLATGQRATALPVVCIALAILISYHFGGLYAIAIAVMSMLSMAGIIISLDAFGPITDNAGGVAVMSDLPHSVREVTDELDAVGNTMKAVTKGYAIASAGLAALVLFGSYVEELKLHLTEKNVGDLASLTAATQFLLNDPRVVVGLFIGGALPFLFTAFSMDAVGNAAGAVVREVRRQLAAKPGILKGEELPEYGTCVDIVTKAALGQMIVPALLPVVVVVAVAAIPALGQVALGGVLMGTIVTGLFLAIAMTSSGGAWDNAKKYIEEGAHGGKGSPAHAASVTGDTVGDPYKDTAGPAINPMIKVVNIVAILIIPLFF
jgi:K(+)-stimulated pyrophosphate-energized sodium pump